MDAKVGSVEPLDVERESRGRDKRVCASEAGTLQKGDAPEADDDGRSPRRDGTWLTATAHIITAVIGSGVLSLGWANAQVGWIFGPLLLIMFSFITWYTAALLTDAYRVGNPLTGRRNYTYSMAVRSFLGPRNQTFCCIVQNVNLFATGIGYTVTGSLSLVAAKRAVCFHAHREAPDAPCSFANIPWMVLFGALQLLFSQIPDFGSLWWLSYLATAMSFAYSIIGLALATDKAVHGSHERGTLWGVAGLPATGGDTAAFNVFVALGSMAFAYSFSMILIEIEDTLRQPPAEKASMKRATHLGVCTTTVFYLLVGCFGYAAFGNASPGNLISGFGFFNPYWLVSAANIFVFIHLIGAYQVFMQPFMTFVEQFLIQFFPRAAGLKWEYLVPLPRYGAFPISPLRLITRSAIVCSATLVAIILPFFNDLVGFIGALGFWPLTVYFPVQMHITVAGVARWSRKWMALQALSAFTLLISLAAAVGSIEFLTRDLKSFTIFDSVSSEVAAVHQ